MTERLPRPPKKIHGDKIHGDTPLLPSSRSNTGDTPLLNLLHPLKELCPREVCPNSNIEPPLALCQRSYDWAATKASPPQYFFLCWPQASKEKWRKGASPGSHSVTHPSRQARRCTKSQVRSTRGHTTSPPSSRSNTCVPIMPRTRVGTKPLHRAKHSAYLAPNFVKQC
jgi:hypothetical protein